MLIVLIIHLAISILEIRKEITVRAQHRRRNRRQYSISGAISIRGP